MRGKDGNQIAAAVGPELDYLSGISRRLGVRDLVADYFTPVVGDWNDLHDEAERWRKAGLVAEHVTRDLTKPLGKLDSAWQGKDADSFVEHMQKVGLAGHDMSDAMHAMGEALDHTAEGIRDIVEDMSRVFAEAADTVSGAAALPVDGDRRVMEALDELHDPAKELHESVRDVLEAFLRLCDGVSGSADFADVKMEHKYPEQNWTFTEPAKPTVPQPRPPRRPRPSRPLPAVVPVRVPVAACRVAVAAASLVVAVVCPVVCPVGTRRIACSRAGRRRCPSPVPWTRAPVRPRRPRVRPVRRPPVRAAG